jgi:hypothetical protein
MVDRDRYEGGPPFARYGDDLVDSLFRKFGARLVFEAQHAFASA